jgi:hypothetical protein
MKVAASPIGRELVFGGGAALAMLHCITERPRILASS